MFALEVQLLTGRYVASEYNDRSSAEWPPHPARLFSALTAAHFDQTDPDPEERAALEWLQCLDPPEIAASDASLRDVVTVFVPVNDTTVVGSFEDVASSVETAQAQIVKLKEDVAAIDAIDSAGSIAVEKHLARAEKALLAANKKFLAKVASLTVPGKETKSGPAEARAMLPEHRGRQPRSFPSATAVDPVIVFVWRKADLPIAHEQPMRNLTSRIARLGHSSSLVSVSLAVDAPASTWHPDDAGERVLRVPRVNQLSLLEDAFLRHQETQPRVLPARHQRYTTKQPEPEEQVDTSVFEQNWLVLHRVGGALLPPVAGPGLATTMRKALVRFSSETSDSVPEVLSGHEADGAPSRRPHLAIVPLPIVGWPKVDGSIVGVAIVLPRSVTREERIEVYRAVDRWERERADSAKDLPEIRVHLGTAGEISFRRIEGLAIQKTLRPETWCIPSRNWVTATPLALDRNPGDLRSRDVAKRERAYREAEESIREGCQRIGLPQPSLVEILPQAPLVGSAKARQYRRFPADESRTQRVLTHAAIQFEDLVTGPIMIGAGRYLGLGLMRPSRGLSHA